MAEAQNVSLGYYKTGASNLNGDMIEKDLYVRILANTSDRKASPEQLK